MNNQELKEKVKNLVGSSLCEPYKYKTAADSLELYAKNLGYIFQDEFSEIKLRSAATQIHDLCKENEHLCAQLQKVNKKRWEDCEYIIIYEINSNGIWHTKCTMKGNLREVIDFLNDLTTEHGQDYCQLISVQYLSGALELN